MAASLQHIDLAVWLVQPDFWSALLAEFVRDRTLWLTFAVLLTAGLLSRVAPHEHKHIRTALVFYGLYLCLLPLAVLFEQFSFAPAVKYVRLFGTIFLGISIINLSSLFLFDVLLTAVHLRTPRILRDTMMLFAYLVGALWLFKSRGADITGIIATSTVLTAVIGLSMQDTLGNIMAGLALQMEHVIQVGDWIKIDQHVGLVKEIRWRQTTIETRNWDTVVIPNSQLMKGQVMIYGRRENAPLQTRRWVYFNVDFRFPPSDVIARVDEALRSAPIENVAPEPKINTVLMDFKESYGYYAVRYWLTNLAADDPTDSVVRTRIYYALKRAGIPLSIPAHSIFITEETKKRQVKKHEQEVEHRLEAIRRVELFHSMTEEELRELASHLRYAPFSRGEVVTRQGAEGHWLYVITSGQVAVRVTLNGSMEKEVARLYAGDFFGEMSLMTGEPRSATVVALEDIECYRLDKEAFKGILAARPEIAEDISHILARRRIELDAVLEGLNAEAHSGRVNATQSHILNLIRGFFGL